MADQHQYRIVQCRSCPARIIFARTDKRSTMPVDEQPSPAGSLRLYRVGGAVLVRVVPVAMRNGATDLRTPHHQTCSDAAAWRKKNKTAGQKGVLSHQPHAHRARDGEPKAHDGRTVCQDCRKLGKPGDAQHPVDAQRLGERPRTPAPPGVTLWEAQRLGERTEDSDA